MKYMPFTFLGWISVFIIAVFVCSNRVYGEVWITELMASNNEFTADEDGEYPDWIELYNDSNAAVHLLGWHLTDASNSLTKWTFPNISIQANQYLLVFASGKDRLNPSRQLHTNFSLNADGEFLAVVRPDETISHAYSPAYPNQNVSDLNISYGITLSTNQIVQHYFLTPTPLAPNQTGVAGFLPPPSFSRQKGFYDNPFQLTLSTDVLNAIIRFTTDGSDPTETNGTVYTNPISITTTAIIRSAVFQQGYAPSPSVTHTYIFLKDVIRQTAPNGYPSRWANNTAADYEMDPDIVNHPNYANTIMDDLKSIPTLSIVMNRDDLFGTRGIYTNPESKGDQWERASSTEWIYTDGRESVQINNGIQIQGGYSRVPDRKKHSFRLVFKRDYGSPKLQHKVFDNSSVTEFDTLTIRGNYNYTWHGGDGGFGSTIGHAEYLRDEFARRTQLDSGQPASHGTYAHLYLNGLYWGVYNIVERPDEAFSASYLGGNKEDYDVITGGTRGINTTQVKSGNKDAWNAMMAIVQRGNFQRDDQYHAIQQYVDLENLIDYMLVIDYTGNRDAPTVIGGNGTPWNFYTTRLRQPGAGLLSFVWDSEWCLEEPDRDVINFHRGQDNPALIFQQLRSNPEFLMLAADRIQKHFFNNGAMTAEASIARYTAIKNKLDGAIVGESARWGDTRGGSPKTRNEDWRNEVNRLLNTYFPVRTENVLRQLRNYNLFPSVDAPKFNHLGGEVETGFELTMASQTFSQIDIPLIEMNSSWKYYQQGNDLRTAWRSPGFSDASWQSGNSLFYVETSDLPSAKNTPLTLGHPTYYFRKSFTIDSSLDLSQTTFQLETIIDDGAIIYINGVELYRAGMPNGTVQFQNFANRTVTNAAVESSASFPGTLFRYGTNVIAVEVHQVNSTSSDIVFGLSLQARTNAANTVSLPVYYTTDGTDPRLSGGAVNPTSILYNQPLIIQSQTQVKARTLSNGIWSAVNEVSLQAVNQNETFVTAADFLRVSELMYDPLGGGEMEYIELYNSHPAFPMRLDGAAFNQGIQFVFPVNTVMDAGEYLLVTKAGTLEEIAAFRTEYHLSNDVPIMGPYTGQLANEGERISITSGESEIISFEYSDGRGWHIHADGAGHSLVPLSNTISEPDQSVLDYGGNWRASYAIGGSPGKQDSEPQTAVVINEFMASTQYSNSANPAYSSNDWIELYNNSVEAVNLTQWFLSDDKDDLKKWAVPAVQAPAFGLISFDEVTGFHNPIESGFGLSNDGEEIYLSYLPGVPGQDRVVDAVSFKAQENNISQGRYMDGGRYWSRQVPTRDAVSQPLSIPIVIDEILYAPSAEVGNADSGLFEYIELVNQSNETVDLGDAEHPYRFDGGVDFVFPAQTMLTPNSRLLVVSFDPTNNSLKSNFLAQYGLDENQIQLAGPYNGRLSNRGERIALEKAKNLDAAGLPASWVVMDEVIYFSMTPWAASPAQFGLSLQRTAFDHPGNDPLNWTGEEPSPGKSAETETTIQEWNLY